MQNDVDPSDAPNDPEATPDAANDKGGGPRTVLTLIVLATVLLLLITVCIVIRWKNQPEASAALTIEVDASPADSEILIDGKPAVNSLAAKELQPGKHELFVSRSGYHSWHQSVVVTGSLTIPVTLQPIPMDLHIQTGQSKAEVWMDDRPQDSTHDSPGELTVTGISAETHLLRIRSAAGESTLSFDFRNGNAPVPILPQTGPTLVFISSFTGKVLAECNCKAQLQLNDVSQTLEPGSPASFMLAEGTYMAELTGISGGKKSVTFMVGPSPAATLALFWPTNNREKSAPDIQTLLNSSMNQLKDSKCDSAQSNVDQILLRDPANVDAIGISRRITRLRSVGGCR